MSSAFGKAAIPGPIQVLFCADRHYLQHAAVAAVSLAMARGSPAIDVHIMTMDEDPAAQRMMTDTLRPFPHVTLTFHTVRDARLADAHADRYITRDAYLRFLAADVLPASVRRVIYLDCDVVVLDDLSELWTADLGSRAVGAVAEVSWDADDRLERLGIAAGHVYINSGVLLMDLDRWRRDGLAARLFQFVSERGASLQFHDQDALNAVLQRDIALLDRRWNVQVMMFSRWMRRTRPADFQAFRAACRNPGIIHYSTDRKPWKLRVWTRKRHLYYRFLRRTAWARTAAPTGVLPRLEHWLSRTLLPLGLDPYIVLPIWQRLRRRS